MIPLGILAAQAPPAAAGAFELISTTTLTSNTASVTFSSIPQDYKHLQIRHVVKSTAAFNDVEFHFRINGITTSSYRSHRLTGNGSSVASGSTATVTYGRIGRLIGSGSGVNASAFGANVADVLDYASTTKNTTVRALYGYHGNTVQVELASSALFTTAAVTSFELFPEPSFLFSTGSRFSLYGIRG